MAYTRQGADRAHSHSISRNPSSARASTKTDARTDRRLKRAGVCAFALSVAFAGTAFAQQPPATAQASNTGPVEEIQVTGSRIQRTGMETPTPVTAVTASELTQMSPGQLVESLSALPQFFNNQTPQTTGYPSSGASNLNLRGAGANRTLVLLDGRRMVPSNRLGTVDIGAIPQELIRNVETVTGGASAAYGTDAVAGVVNFLLNTDYTGIKGHLQGGETQYGDGQNWEASLAFGTDVGEKFHLLGSVDFFRQKSIDSFSSLRKRDYRTQRARVTNPDPNGPNQIIRPYAEPTNFSKSGVILWPKGVDLPRYEFLSDGTAVPLEFSGVGQVNGGCNCQATTTQTYGVDADDQIAPKSKTGSAFLYLDYDPTDNLKIFVQGLYGNSMTNSRPSGITLVANWQGTIFSGNPYLPANIQALMDNPQHPISSFGFGFLGDQDPNSPVGDDRTEQENDTYTGTGGFKATFADGLFNSKFMTDWHANGYVQYGKAIQHQRFLNSTRIDKLPLAMDVVTDPKTGAPACYAALANPTDFGDCVPIDLFGGVDHISKEAAAYITEKEKDANSITQQWVGELVFDGQVWKGFGAGPVSLAWGGSYRKEKFKQYTVDPCDEFVCINGVNTELHGLIPYDPATGEGMFGVRPGSVPAGYIGNGASASAVQFTATNELSGGYNVKEAFAELDVPLLQGLTMVKQLDLSLAGRWADYQGSGTIWAWKYGLSWDVAGGLRLRATQSRDVRAATLQERFDLTGGGGTVQDPAFNNATFSIGTFSGGNPNVNPEKADTTTIGIIYQPTFLSGFSTSLDWYKINVKDAIAQLSAQDLLNGCEINGDKSFCALVDRDPASGQITRIHNVFINIAKQRISGIDLEASYRTDLTMLGGGAERLSMRLFGTYLHENSLQNPGSAKDDRAGDDFPKYKATANLTYANGPVSLFLQERYIDSTVLDRTLTQSDVRIPGVQTIDNNHVPSVWYTDLRLTYTLGESDQWQIYGSVTNLFNQNPPASPGAVGRGGTTEFSNGLYDTIGRRFVVGARFNY